MSMQNDARRAAPPRRSFTGATLLTAIAVAALVVGCGSPWQTIRQARPDPFLGQRAFAVMPVVYENLRVGDLSEAQYLAEKDQDTRAKWAGDKQGFNERFAERLVGEARENGIQVVAATGPGSAPFFVRPVVTWIEPGFEAIVASAPTRVTITVQLTTPDGGVLDEITMEPRIEGGFAGMAAATRIRDAGAVAGEWTADYLKSRVAP